MSPKAPLPPFNRAYSHSGRASYRSAPKPVSFCFSLSISLSFSPTLSLSRSLALSLSLSLSPALSISPRHRWRYFTLVIVVDCWHTVPNYISVLVHRRPQPLYRQSSSSGQNYSCVPVTIPTQRSQVTQIFIIVLLLFFIPSFYFTYFRLPLVPPDIAFTSVNIVVLIYRCGKALDLRLQKNTLSVLACPSAAFSNKDDTLQTLVIYIYWECEALISKAQH